MPVRNLLQKWEIDQLNLPDGRMYRKGNIAFPSVSTILSAISDQTALNNWKARVGHQQALFHSKQATNYGSHFHGVLEKFLLEDIEPFMPQMKAETYEIISLFKKGVTIRAVEYPLISERLQAAGTVDCICEMAGVPVIVDFKTYGKRLYPDTVAKYQIQAAFYAMMANEMYDLNIQNLIILAKKPHTKLRRIHRVLDESMKQKVWDAVKKYQETRNA